MCKNHPNELLPELSHAESVMQQNPDSALLILNSMKIPSRSDKFQYATWCLLMTQARDKNYIKHESDSLINNALNYFEKQNNPKRKATALYYKARVNHDMGNVEDATDFYLRARDVAQQTNDYKLLFLINSQLGSLYIYRDLNDLALDAYQQAYKYAIQLKDSVCISYSLSYLGRVYAVDTCWEQSVEYYKEAAFIAEEHGNFRAFGDALSEISAVYNRMNQLDSSIYYGRKALLWEDDSLNIDSSSLYFGLGHTYSLLGEYEMADTFLKKAIQGGNIYTVESAYQVLSELNRKLGKYEDALKYNDQYLLYADSIDKIDRGEKIAEIQKKYDHAKLQNANNQLAIEKDRIKNIALLIFVILLISINILIIIYQRKLLNKERKIQQTKDQLQSHLIRLHENETEIRKNKELISSLSSQLSENMDLHECVNDQKQIIESIRQKNESLQAQNNSLKKEIEGFTKSLYEKGTEIRNYELLSEQNSHLQERELYLCDQLIKQMEALNSLKQDPKSLSESQWSEVMECVDHIYPQFTTRLRRDFPTLTEGDLLICCFLKLHLNNPTIAILMGVSNSSVTKRKQRLKERISQHLETPLPKEISLETFIWGY